ncbi:MAG TPA: hypothetical protein DDZ51_24270 [Planctomycetaceae bacterium]|nr:hypothetical protein [Planctomycetaceae bacterium]
MQNGTFIRVFIASPGDVYQERDEACRVIHNWNAAHSVSRSVLIEPVRVETHSHALQGGHPQDLINSQLLDRCDLLVAILWSRLGTPTNSDLSGTVQEIREFSERKGPERVLIFFCDRALPNSSDLSQVQAVRDFKDSIKSNGLYAPYTEVAEFGSSFRHQLDLALNRILEGDEFIAVADQSQRVEVVFTPEANTILAAATMAARPSVTLNSSLRRGYVLSAGGKCLNSPGDERSEARWESGLEQLESCSFVKDASHKGEVFRLTKEGFEAADRLWYVLILRRIESIQSQEPSYVNYADIINEPFFGQKISDSFLREKLQSMASMEQLEIVPVDGGIGAASLNDVSRKSLREHSFLEFAEPEGDDD